MALHQIERLLPRHFRIIELALTGMNQADIAAELKMTPVAITYILSSPIVQNEIARRRRALEKKADEAHSLGITRAKSILEENAHKAAQLHVDVLENEAEETRTRQLSANAILDRVYGARGGTDQQSVTVINAEQVQLLQVALSESNAAAEPVT